MRVSMSEIGGFTACRYQWDWGSPNRQNRTPRGTVPGALWLGTGVHHALERWYRSGMNGEEHPADPATIFHEWALGQEPEEQPADSSKLHALGYTMLTGYVERYGWDPMGDVDGWVPLTLEQEWPVPIPSTNGGVLVGTIDGLIRDRNGGIWAIDHKTYSNKPREDLFILNQQFLGYTYALQRLSNGGALERFGVPTHTPILGVLWNGLRKMQPGPGVKQPLFAREWVDHNQAELARFEERLIAIYNEMSNPNLALYPSPGDACGWCGFSQPCIARQLGEDYDWLIETNYTPGEPRGQVYKDTP